MLTGDRIRSPIADQVNILFREPRIPVEYRIGAERHAAVGYGIPNLHALVRRVRPPCPVGEIELGAAFPYIPGQYPRHWGDMAIPRQDCRLAKEDRRSLVFKVPVEEFEDIVFPCRNVFVQHVVAVVRG
jgi:hypothetical protein